MGFEWAPGGLQAEVGVMLKHVWRRIASGDVWRGADRGGGHAQLHCWRPRAKPIRDVKEQVMVLALVAEERAIALERP